MPITPVIRGLYLCERVDVDPLTKNLTLHECFRTLLRDPISGSVGPFYVVAYLANGFGTVGVSVRIARLDSLGDFYSTNAPLSFTDRHVEIRFKLRIVECRFPGPGEYQVSLWVNNDLLAQTPFRIRDENRS
jgi:hypothetical protein